MKQFSIEAIASPVVRVAAILALLTGCGSKARFHGHETDPGTATVAACTATLSGDPAVAGTQDCEIHWYYRDYVVEPFYVSLFAPELSPHPFSVEVHGIEPELGSHSSGEMGTVIGFLSSEPALSKEPRPTLWRIRENQRDPATGSYALTVTGLSDRGELDGLHSWDIDGTFDAVFGVDAYATEEVSLHVDF